MRPVVAIITSNFWPEQTGIGQVTTEFAQYLSANDIDVRVATAMPYYPAWTIYPAYRGRGVMTEFLGKIVVHRAWHYAAPAPGALGRLAHEASLCLFLVPQMLRALRGADTVYIVSPDLSLAFVASLLSRIAGVKRILIVEDVQPEAAVDLGMLRNARLIKLAEWMARSIYESSDEIYTLSDGMRRRIAIRATDAKKISLMPNTIDVTEFASTDSGPASFREKFLTGLAFSVVHAGNMGQKQDLDLILRAAKRLGNNSPIRFLVFGDGAVKDEFVRKRDEARLSNVSHFPFQTRDMVPHMLREADVVLVSQLPQVVDIVVPLKLTTAMAAGAMIIAACSENSEAAQVVKESGGGIVIPPSNDEALCDVLLALCAGEIDVTPFRRAARTYAAAHFDRDAIYSPHVAAIKARREA